MKPGIPAESKGKDAGPQPAPDYVPTLGKSRLETMSWLMDGPPELADYAGKWVVAAGKRIVSAADAGDEAIAKAEEAGVSPEEMVVDYVEEFPRIYRIAQR